MSIALVISIFINILMFVNFLSSKKNTNEEINLLGIYQITYLNRYDHSMTITLKLKEGGKCEISDHASDYNGDYDECDWVVNGNNIQLNKTITDLITNENKIIEKQIEILSSGNLLYDYHELKKIS